MIVEQLLYVVRILFDTEKNKFHYTVSKDAVRIYTSGDYNTIPEACEDAQGKWSE